MLKSRRVLLEKDLRGRVLGHEATSATLREGRAKIAPATPPKLRFGNTVDVFYPANPFAIGCCVLLSKPAGSGALRSMFGRQVPNLLLKLSQRSIHERGHLVYYWQPPYINTQIVLPRRHDYSQQANIQLAHLPVSETVAAEFSCRPGRDTVALKGRGSEENGYIQHLGESGAILPPPQKCPKSWPMFSSFWDNGHCLGFFVSPGRES